VAELKTRPSDDDVTAFLEGIEDEGRRADCFDLLKLMRRVTGEEPRLWGSSIVGFGSYHYEYESGREGDWFVAGFAPRKRALTLYIMSGFSGHDELMARLGRHTTGKSCLYIGSLEDVDRDVLEELVSRSAAHLSGSRPE